LANLGVAAKIEFSVSIQPDLPCPVLRKKYSSFDFQKFMVDCPYSAPTQGAYRDRHERGAEGSGRTLC
jgi:hypothetical protein